MSDTVLICDNLRGEMARRRKSSADLAKSLGCSQQYARQKLKGDSDFTISDMEHIADMFGLTLLQLLMLLLQPIDSIKQIQQ